MEIIYDGMVEMDGWISYERKGREKEEEENCM